MKNSALLDAIASSDVDTIQKLIQSGLDLNERDENGSTALHWAAANGTTPVIDCLLQNGADVAVKDSEGRTPSMVAQAAGRKDSAALIVSAPTGHEQTEISTGSVRSCRGYCLRDLENFPLWHSTIVSDSSPESDVGDLPATSVDMVVYVHDDFTVTRSIWRGENIMLEQTTPEWIRYCRDVLHFHPINLK